MKKLIALQLIFLAICGNAPFVLSPNEASIMDSKINVDSCVKDKNRYTRYFWYSVRAQYPGAVIDMGTVEFQIIKGGDRKAHAVIFSPFVSAFRFDGNDDKLIAYGRYYLSSGETELTCINGNSTRQ